MKLLSNLRFLTYIIVLVAFILVRHQTRVIPVHLSGDDEEDWFEKLQLAQKTAGLKQAQQYQQENEKIPQNKLFEKSTKSGSQVIDIARSAATKDGGDLTNFFEPKITLQKRNERLVWFVSFYGKSDIRTGNFFTVEIDDLSGKTTIHPGM